MRPFDIHPIIVRRWLKKACELKLKLKLKLSGAFLSRGSKARIKSRKSSACRANLGPPRKFAFACGWPSVLSEVISCLRGSEGFQQDSFLNSRIQRDSSMFNQACLASAELERPGGLVSCQLVGPGDIVSLEIRKH